MHMCVSCFQGGSGQTDMEALERQADKIRAAKAKGAGAAGAAGGSVEANPEEIDLDMDMDDGVSCFLGFDE